MNTLKTMTAAAALMLVAGAANAQTLNSSDITAVADASRNNEIRFNRDYRGKTFSDLMIFNSADENIFAAGSYWLRFQSGKSASLFGGGVTCRTSDQSVLNEVADWNKGQQVLVTGTVRTTQMGIVHIDDCKFVKN